MLDDAEDAAGGAADIVERGGLATGDDTLGGTENLVIGNGSEADLAAPAIDVGGIAAGHAGERNDADIGGFTIGTDDFEGGDAHLAGGHGGPISRGGPGEGRDGLGI